MARHLLAFHADSEGTATSTPGFIVAVNTLLLSSSPLKIREHAGLGCLRQSLPRMVGSRGCGSDRSTHWACPSSGSLPTTAGLRILVSLKVFLDTDLKSKIPSKRNREEGYLIRDCTNGETIYCTKGNTDWWPIVHPTWF
uniref:Uncharacterized protein n=1 Tax=Balaenoptera musculus TaxID=9771 RepID=A0A8C0DV67_BALMU